jgi:ribosome-binding protein aMBF1 (putative translation factor)
MQDSIELRKRLGERVRSLREKRGWSQEELSHETGFGRSFMSAIERGKKTFVYLPSANWRRCLMSRQRNC